MISRALITFKGRTGVPFGSLPVLTRVSAADTFSDHAQRGDKAAMTPTTRGKSKPVARLRPRANLCASRYHARPCFLCLGVALWYQSDRFLSIVRMDNPILA